MIASILCVPDRHCCICGRVPQSSRGLSKVCRFLLLVPCTCHSIGYTVHVLGVFLVSHCCSVRDVGIFDTHDEANHSYIVSQVNGSDAASSFKVCAPPFKVCAPPSFHISFDNHAQLRTQNGCFIWTRLCLHILNLQVHKSLL